MPAFDTPQPILAVVEIITAAVRIRAAERATTSVDVAPTDPANPEDVRLAQQTRSSTPTAGSRSGRRSCTPGRPGNAGSIDVTIELPSASDLQASGQMASFDCDGPLAKLRIKTGIGPIRVDRAATLTLKAGAGDIEVGAVSGHAEISAGSGDIRVRELDGTGRDQELQRRRVGRQRRRRPAPQHGQRRPAARRGGSRPDRREDRLRQGRHRRRRRRPGLARAAHGLRQRPQRPRRRRPAGGGRRRRRDPRPHRLRRVTIHRASVIERAGAPS